MSHLLIYLEIGGGIAFALIWWFVKGQAPRASNPYAVHTSLADALEHRPYILTGRIFADDDWQLARASLSRKDQKQFLRDRKVVALMLLDEIRFRAGQIMYLHRTTAREAVELKSSAEMKLAATYASLLVCCAALQIFVRLRGPFAASQIAERLSRAADNLWLGFEAFRARLHPMAVAGADTTDR